MDSDYVFKFMSADTSFTTTPNHPCDDTWTEWYADYITG